jgi:hypothetical protein
VSAWQVGTAIGAAISTFVIVGNVWTADSVTRSIVAGSFVLAAAICATGYQLVNAIRERRP